MKLLNIIFIISIVILLSYFSSCNLYNTTSNSVINKCKNISISPNVKIDFINGYWTSDNDFAKMSDIDEMILNIDIENKKGFLVIVVEKKIVSNDEFDILLNKDCNEIEFVSDNINFIWNEKKFNFDISLIKGSLVLYYEDTIFASLYKDNKMTALLS